MQRNYHELSPFDFECLIRDLLQEEFKERLEVFSPGRDGGVDVRLFSNCAQNKYVQCKHSPLANYSAIKSNLAKEAAKVRGRFSDGEYWLATSAGLTPANKAHIASLFGEDFLAENRILSKLDCDNLLNIHPNVELKHYKLYITSMAVLQRVVANEIYFRREVLLSELTQRLRLFVHTPAFEQALSILADLKTCIISGEPGIGKSTLAEMLLVKLVDDGYEAVVVSEDISEAEKLYSVDRKQVFFYDDFLGQSSLADKLGKNEDDRLVRIIRQFRRGSQHLFLLTTREYILTQAQQTYPRLSRGDIDLYKFVLDLKTYNEFHKAHILYNHIYFSDLSGAARDALLNGKAYHRIIGHNNYSPRLIEMIVKFALKRGEPDDGPDFSNFAISTLNDPAELWRDVFECQLSMVGRDILITLATFPSGTVATRALRAAVDSYSQGVRGQPHDYVAVTQSLAILNGVMIQVDSQGDENQLTRFANPSFRDFLTQYLGRNLPLIEPLLLHVDYFEQYQQLLEWAWPTATGGRLDNFRGLQRQITDNANQIMARIQVCVNHPPLTTPTRLKLLSPATYLGRIAIVSDLVAHADPLDSKTICNFAEAVRGKWQQRSFWLALSASDKGVPKRILEPLLGKYGGIREVEALYAVALNAFSFNSIDAPDLMYRAELIKLKGAQVDNFANEFENRIQEFTQNILSLHDVDDVVAERDLLMEAADYFDVDASDAVDEIDQHIAYLESAQDAIDDNPGGSWRPSNFGQYRAEIDRLFDTLRD